MAAVPKLLADTAARLLFTPATVGAVTDHDGFRTIELVGERLRDTAWVPGDKLRIHIEGTKLRTYTPMSWDREAGSTRLLAYLPGDGPGAEWCAGAEPGTACVFLGPNRSVRLDRLAAPPVFVGDETSFGLFLAWRNLHPDVAPAAAIFEVGSTAAAARVLSDLGAHDARLVARLPHDGHLAALEDTLVEAVRAAPTAPLCLTGRAQTIAPLRRRLKAEGLTRGDTSAKAYWDERRKGLD